MRVLIVLPGALGDVVRALPLLGRLRRGAPGACLGWVVEPLSSPLLEGHPWLDEVVRVPRRGGLRGAIRALRAVRAFRPDVALDLGRGAKSALFALWSGARRRLGFARGDAREASWLVATERLPEQGSQRAKLEQYLAFGDVLGLPPVEVAFGLEPTPQERLDAARMLDGLSPPRVAACVGSSCPARRWFSDRTAGALEVLVARTRGSAVLLGTAADTAFAAAVAQRSQVPLRNLSGRTDLRQLLAILAQVDVVVGPDSGALHLAAALGTPVVSLWGATSAARSAPWGSEHLVVEGRAPCAPCFLRHCPIGRVCMRGIEVDAVVARAREALGA